MRDHRERVDTVGRRSRGRTVVSHLSAATVHGLPVLCGPPGSVEVITPRRSGGKRTADRHVRPLPLEEWERSVIDGVAVTSVARTLVDVAATRSHWVAVPMIDTARARELVRPSEMHRVVAAHPTLVGCRRALHALWLSTDRAYGPVESLSRMVMRASRQIPQPELGVRALGFDDEPLGRLAFHWPERRAAAIVDESEQDGGDPRREQLVWELGQLGLTVLRWGWSDVTAPERLIRMIREVVDLRVPDPTPWF